MDRQTEKGLEEAGEIQLYFEHHKQDDSRPTLVLLHGFLSSSFSFRKLVPYLTAKYNIMSIDLPPFGLSGKSSRYHYSFRNLAHSVVQLLERKEINPFAIIGHSMGGQVTLQLIHDHPRLAERVVLLAGSGYQPAFPNKMRYLSYIPFFSLGVKRYLEKSGLERNLRNVVFNQAMIDDEMREGYLSPFMQKHDIFRALGLMLRHKEVDLLENELGKIETPCLLIWGRYDKVVPLSIGERLHRDLRHSELAVIEEAGHLLPEEKPEEVYQLMQAFFVKEKKSTVE